MKRVHQVINQLTRQIPADIRQQVADYVMAQTDLENPTAYRLVFPHFIGLLRSGFGFKQGVMPCSALLAHATNPHLRKLMSNWNVQFAPDIDWAFVYFGYENERSFQRHCKAITALFPEQTEFGEGFEMIQPE